MRLGKVLLIAAAVVLALGSAVLIYGLYLQPYYIGGWWHNLHANDVLFKYKDVLVDTGYGIIAVGIGLVIGGFIKITKVCVDKKQIINARIQYFEALMADNGSLKEDIEKAYNLYIKKINLKPVKDIYYDKKLKRNFTPAVWAALYWSTNNNNIVSKIDPGNELFGGSTPSAVITGPAPPPSG